MRYSRVLLACSALALLGFRDPGCGGGSSDRAGLNAPCTRAKDCASSLRCFEGVCVPEDASVPDAAKEASVDAAGDVTDAADASDDTAPDAGGDL